MYNDQRLLTVSERRKGNSNDSTLFNRFTGGHEPKFIYESRGKVL